MTTEGLPYGVHIVVGDPKLLTCLSYDRSDQGIVGLDDTREEMVSGLVIESTSEHIPEPAVSGVVLCRGHLHLRPGCVCVCVCACMQYSCSSSLIPVSSSTYVRYKSTGVSMSGINPRNLIFHGSTGHVCVCALSLQLTSPVIPSWCLDQALASPPVNENRQCHSSFSVMSSLPR